MPSMTNTTSPKSGCAVLTPGTPGTPGRGFVAICTAAGNVKITFANGSTMVLPLIVGPNSFDYAVLQVDLPSTLAAAAVFYNLY